MPMRVGLCLVAAIAWFTLAGRVSAQLGDSSFEQLDHPAIQYGGRPAQDPVAALSVRLEAGDLRLPFDPAQGYLRSLLGALAIPIESQVVVFSKTSTQLNLVQPRTPRAIYFNDSVAVAWIRGTFVLEIAAQDPEQGTIFYEMENERADQPTLRRTRACLRCHHSLYTNGVPGRLMRSTLTAADGTAVPWAGNVATDHRTPFDRRWGGWYVTGQTSGLPHMGNGFATGVPPTAALRGPDIDRIGEQFDATAYVTPYSDVVSLMVLEHQGHLTNLLTRLNWETRAADYEARTAGSVAELPLSRRAPFSLEAAVSEIVDYLLFVDEAPLPGRVHGTSGFAEQFAGRGPFDRQGRSLRQLDLERRLMRYRCSYMIYSPSFDALPAATREAIYKRMWQILGGSERAGKYAALTGEERAAVTQMLRETKKDLPDYFGRN